MTQKILTELTPADQAHALGLEYGGFGQWIDKNRVTKARTVDGKLVKVDGEEESNTDADLGILTVLVFEDSILHIKGKTRFVGIFNKFLKAVVNRGHSFVLICNRGSERAVAEYLRSIGLQSGLKILPMELGDPFKMKDYVQQKIDQGFRTIEYFDANEKNIKSVESLKATYNKLDIEIDTHKYTKQGEYK